MAEWIIQLHGYDENHVPLWKIVREDGKPMDSMTLCKAISSVSEIGDTVRSDYLPEGGKA